MKTITICGSMRFAEQMKQIAWKLESKQGFCVLQGVYNERNEDISYDELKCLALAHYQKIDLCDAIYIVDIDGYIGTSLEQEMVYAKNIRKRTYFSQL